MPKRTQMMMLAALLIFSACSTPPSGAEMQAEFDRAAAAYDAQDYQTARQIWERLGAYHDLAALRNLGHIYRRGLGVDIDFAQAFDYYKQASERGFAPAQYNLSMMYFRGEGTEKNREKALFWMQQSADGGFQSARAFMRAQNLKMTPFTPQN